MYNCSFLQVWLALVLLTPGFSVRCPRPDQNKFSHGTVSVNAAGTFARYKCNYGYKIIGSTRRRCISSGRWSGSIPVCIPSSLRCPPLEILKHGWPVTTGYSVGSIATYRCDTGYELEGVAERTCTSFGTWSGEVPKCTGQACPHLMGIPHGGVTTPSIVLVGSKALYWCNPGYEIVGPTQRTCLNSGKWSETPLPTCRGLLASRCENTTFECCSCTGHCVDSHNFCDGKADCSDKTDEIAYDAAKHTAKDGIPCHHKRYIGNVCLLRKRQEKKKVFLCSNDTECNQGFLCADKNECIKMNQFCDETPDCRDKSDEIWWNDSIHNETDGTRCRHKHSEKICFLPREQNKKMKRICKGDTSCSNEYDYLCKYGGRCIHAQSFCDKKKDCKAGDDEVALVYNSSRLFNISDDGIPCRNRKFVDRVCELDKSRSIHKEAICRKSAKCDKGMEFSCANGVECIGTTYFCDGHVDCSDHSDEIVYDKLKHNETFGIPCSRGYYTCLLPTSQAYKEKLICHQDLTCPGGFLCNDEKKCIDGGDFCDGKKDCRDGLDEIVFNSTGPNVTLENGLQCRNRHFLNNVCLIREEVHPRDFCREDDKCEREFLCSDGKECIRLTEFCDGDAQCSDGSDEVVFSFSDADILKGINGIPCRNKVFLNNVCVLPELQIAKKASICRESAVCGPEEYLCADGVKCVDGSSFCDGIYDCMDASDEIPYFGETANGTLCRKRGRLCLLPTRESGKVEQLCNNDVLIGSSIFYCFSDLKPLTIRRMCDGVVDCDDLSDECLCNYGSHLSLSEPLCEHIDWSPTSGAANGTHATTNGESCPGMLYCNVRFVPTCVAAIKVCDRQPNCDDALDERYCLLHNEEFEKCSGVPWGTSSLHHECYNCDNPPEYCKYVILEKGELLFKCPNFLLALRDHEVCDGINHCRSGEEDERTCPNRFLCGALNIPKTHTCDLVQDCENSEDELGCESRTRECETEKERDGNNGVCKTHYYCNETGEIMYIDSRKVCDGTTDCMSGGDECKDWCIESVFSSTESLISSKYLLPLIWLISLFAFFGNLIVIGYTMRNMICPLKKMSQIEKGQSVLVLNLSAADFLVGVYTSSICLKSALSDRYCIIDQEWRSGTACSILGAILVIGSEESVMALTIITAFRLVAVWRPFVKPSVRVFWICMVISWALSMSMALIPFATSLEDYFTESIWFSQNPLFTTVQYNEIENVTQRLVALLNKTSQYSFDQRRMEGWSVLKELIATLNPDFQPQRTFGYYSAHGVCLPRLFPDRRKIAAWSFSLFIIMLNFFSFVFIVCAYVFIFRRATKVNVRKTVVSQQTSDLQQKITRIVITDFCCWMPICVMVMMQISGITITEDVYVPVGTILMPINSALNPFLYSNAPEWIWRKLLPARNWIHASFNSVHEHEDILSETGQNLTVAETLHSMKNHDEIGNAQRTSQL